jgi:hypothetical protein
MKLTLHCCERFNTDTIFRFLFTIFLCHIHLGIGHNSQNISVRSELIRILTNTVYNFWNVSLLIHEQKSFKFDS